MLTSFAIVLKVVYKRQHMSLQPEHFG